ncbi:chitosanase [Paenibacillus sp. N3.4]|uniref:chitosanase n=1 Tax=Paenibacillus sp. N3.4 TaxID=2603222 RepID=UPI0021C3DCE6|nr:chitosanase [Paenibacillus sp. N3.4]
MSMSMTNAKSAKTRIKLLSLVMICFAVLLTVFGGQPRAQAANSHDANFSPTTLQFLKTNTGLDGEQWDNIMKLINKPEQDTLNWTKFYGYCEDIKDNRGYTIGIFGARPVAPTTLVLTGLHFSRNSMLPAGQAIHRFKADCHELVYMARCKDRF